MIRNITVRRLLVYAPYVVLLAMAGAAAYAYAVFGDDIRFFMARQDKAAQYERLAFFDQREHRLVDYIAGQDLTGQELPSFCNNLIFEHSQKGYVDEYNRKVKRIMGLLAEHIQDPSRPKPLTKCDSRALVLGSLLKAFGIKSRIVHAGGYGLNNEFVGHTFLEVQEGNGWAVYDPYFGLSYKPQANGNPVSAMQAMLSDIDDLIPVSPDGEGWEANKGRVDKQFMDRLYCLVIYDNRMNGEKSTVVVNCARIARVTGGAVSQGLDQTFQEYLRQKWFAPVFIYL